MKNGQSRIIIVMSKSDLKISYRTNRNVYDCSAFATQRTSFFAIVHFSYLYSPPLLCCAQRPRRINILIALFVQYEPWSTARGKCPSVLCVGIGRMRRYGSERLWKRRTRPNDSMPRDFAFVNGSRQHVVNIILPTVRPRL